LSREGTKQEKKTKIENLSTPHFNSPLTVLFVFLGKCEKYVGGVARAKALLT
jgi:hypothetical protein